MKFWAACFLTFVLLVPAPVHAGQTPDSLRRGLFISVIQDPPVLSNREAIEKAVAFAKRARVDTIFLQIYRANKTWFPSRTGDETPYRENLKNVGEDPVALLLRQAHDAGLEVHAWLNLLSLSANGEAPLLKKYGPDILTRKPGEKSALEDYKIDGQYFLEPGDLRVREELSGLLREILTAYPGFDGVQLDYIRYPDRDPYYGYTPQNIGRFRAAYGPDAPAMESNPAWKDWRRAQVTELVALLSARARQLRPGIQVSTTGCSPYARAYLEAFQDWASWIDLGIADFVTMMSYPADLPEFEHALAGARKKTSDFGRVNIGIGAYKLLKDPEIFAGQFEACEKAGGRGCVVFHYGDLLQSPGLAKPLLKNSAPEYPAGAGKS